MTTFWGETSLYGLRGGHDCFLFAAGWDRKSLDSGRRRGFQGIPFCGLNLTIWKQVWFELVRGEPLPIPTMCCYVLFCSRQTCHVGSKMFDECSRRRYSIWYRLVISNPSKKKYELEVPECRRKNDWLFALVHESCRTLWKHTSLCRPQRMNESNLTLWQWNDLHPDFPERKGRREGNLQIDPQQVQRLKSQIKLSMWS